MQCSAVIAKFQIVGETWDWHFQERERERRRLGWTFFFVSLGPWERTSNKRSSFWRWTFKTSDRWSVIQCFAYMEWNRVLCWTIQLSPIEYGQMNTVKVVKMVLVDSRQRQVLRFVTMFNFFKKTDESINNFVGWTRAPVWKITFDVGSFLNRTGPGNNFWRWWWTGLVWNNTDMHIVLKEASLINAKLPRCFTCNNKDHPIKKIAPAALISLSSRSRQPPKFFFYQIRTSSWRSLPNISLSVSTSVCRTTCRWCGRAFCFTRKELYRIGKTTRPFFRLGRTIAVSGCVIIVFFGWTEHKIVKSKSWWDGSSNFSFEPTRRNTSSNPYAIFGWRWTKDVWVYWTLMNHNKPLVAFHQGCCTCLLEMKNTVSVSVSESVIQTRSNSSFLAKQLVHIIPFGYDDMKPQCSILVRDGRWNEVRKKRVDSVLVHSKCVRVGFVKSRLQIWVFIQEKVVLCVATGDVLPLDKNKVADCIASVVSVMYVQIQKNLCSFFNWKADTNYCPCVSSRKKVASDVDHHVPQHIPRKKVAKTLRTETPNPVWTWHGPNKSSW